MESPSTSIHNTHEQRSLIAAILGRCQLEFHEDGGLEKLWPSLKKRRVNRSKISSKFLKRLMKNFNCRIAGVKEWLTSRQFSSFNLDGTEQCGKNQFSHFSVGCPHGRRCSDWGEGLSGSSFKRIATNKLTPLENSINIFYREQDKKEERSRNNILDKRISEVRDGYITTEG